MRTIATIRTAIQINDMMSQQFHAMNMAMSTVIDSFQTLHDTTGAAIDVAALNAAQRELQQVEATFNQVEQEIREAHEQQQKLNQKIKNGENAADGLLGKLGAIVGTYFTLQAIGNAISLSDEMTNTTARLDMMNDGLQTTAELQQMIFDAAQRSYGAYSQTADLVGKLGLNAPEAFGSVAEAVAFAELLNKQFSIAGTSVEGVSAATTQLTQALGSGVLRGEELNSIFEQAPNIIRTIADYLGVGIGEIRGMAAEGEITAEIVKMSMFAAADDINEKFNSMPLTFSQVWTYFQNEALMAFQPVLQKMNEFANSDRLSGFIDSTVSALYIIADAVLFTFEIISAIGSFIYDNWAILGPLIMGVGFILLTFTGYLIGVKLAMLVVTAATWLWNQALAANPIVWIMIAVIALIALFYAVIGAINQFAGTSISATGVIAGAFTTLGAFLWNLFLGFFDLALGVINGLVNPFIVFANFLGNVFVNPISSVINLFHSMADNALAVLETIASAMDFVFGSNMAGTISGWRSGLKDMADAAVAEYAPNENYQEIMSQLDLSSESLGLERWAYGDAWDTGYNFGSNLETGPNINDIMSNSMAGVESLLDAGNAINKDIAKNTGKTADSVEMSSEDLAYLKDIAERTAINRYTTGEIKVDMSGMQNSINYDTDIDGIIDQFAEKLEEAIEIVAEGADGDV